MERLTWILTSFFSRQIVCKILCHFWHGEQEQDATEWNNWIVPKHWNRNLWWIRFLINKHLSTVWVISNDRCLFLCPSHGSEVGGAPLGKAAVTYFCATIRVQQYLNHDVIKVLVLLAHVAAHCCLFSHQSFIKL